VIGKRRLLATRSVAKAGLLDKAGWYGGQTIHNLFGWL
jgi:hypothetical protein